MADLGHADAFIISAEASPAPKAGSAEAAAEAAPPGYSFGTLKGALQCAALGQILSLLVTVTSVSSSMLASQGVSIPASQSFFNYLLLAAFYGTPLLVKAYRSGTTSSNASDALLPQDHTEGTPLLASRDVRQVPWSIWMLTSVLDVEGNYLVVLAFRYTSLTSVALLDCWAIPCAMLLTWRLFGTKYGGRHTMGAVLCMGGLAALLFSDAHSADRSQSGASPLLGDLLVILGASLYAGSNVLVEHLTSGSSPSTVLGWLGIFGSGISVLQLLIFERQELQALALSPSALLPFLAFSLSLFSFYSLVPQMLTMGGAAFFNLSLLTSDVWAVGISALWFHNYVGPLYYVALVTVTIGLSLYSSTSKSPQDPSTKSQDSSSEVPGPSLRRQHPLDQDSA